VCWSGGSKKRVGGGRSLDVTGTPLIPQPPAAGPAQSTISTVSLQPYPASEPPPGAAAKPLINYTASHHGVASGGRLGAAVNYSALSTPPSGTPSSHPGIVVRPTASQPSQPDYLAPPYNDR